LANTRSAMKRQRQAERRRTRNRAVRSSARTKVAIARAAIDQGDSNSAEEVRIAQRTLDIGVRKGTLHPNNAARRKSRLMKRLNAAAAGPS
jgi:small subunit ribosomal protein S20